MSDENKNIENNQEENQNRQECNKIWWKNCWVKTQPTIFICLFLLLNIIVLCGYVKVNGEKNIEKMEIVDFENLKENKLHYFGEMIMPRIKHSVIQINETMFLIVGGINKFGIKRINTGKLPYERDVPITGNYNAELYNLSDNKSRIVGDRFKTYSYKLNELNSTDILLTGVNSIIFNKNKEQFNINEDLFPQNSRIEDKQILIFNHYIILGEGHVDAGIPFCWIYDINEKNINMIKHYKNNEEISNLRLVKLNENEFLLYKYLYLRWGGTSKLYIQKYSLKDKAFIQNCVHDGVGSLVNIVPITNNLILISGCEVQAGNLSNFKLELFDMSKNKSLKKYPVNKLLEFVQINNKTFISSDAEYIFNKENYELISTNINLPVSNPEITRINDNSFMITGGIYEDTKEVSKRIYIYKLGE